MYRDQANNLKIILLNFNYLYNQVCRGGFYGLGCSTSCGYCKSGTVCNDRTGGCPNGCQDHWIGSKCNGTDIKQITLKY